MSVHTKVAQITGIEPPTEFNTNSYVWEGSQKNLEEFLTEWFERPVGLYDDGEMVFGLAHGDPSEIVIGEVLVAENGDCEFIWADA